MKKQNVAKVKKVSIYLMIGVLVLIFEVILYSYIKLVFPGESNFFGLPFDMPMFIFGLTFLMIPLICYLVNSSFNDKLDCARKL